MRSAALTCIEPGASATLIWHGATAARPGKGHRRFATAETFFRTAHRRDAVRVCVLIHNDAGIWTRRLHPFEFAKETA